MYTPRSAATATRRTCSTRCRRAKNSTTASATTSTNASSMNSLPPSADASKRARDWNGVSAVIAALIGLLALCVSGYTAYIQRQQVRAQVWPYLEPGISGSKRELLLFNKGVGPAIIEGVQVLVDGKPQRNWNAVFRALGL